MDAINSKALAAQKDLEETLEAVNEALAEEGEGRPAAEVHAELRKKLFGAPRRSPQTRRQTEPTD